MFTTARPPQDLRVHGLVYIVKYIARKSLQAVMPGWRADFVVFSAVAKRVGVAPDRPQERTRLDIAFQSFGHAVRSGCVELTNALRSPSESAVQPLNLRA